MDQNITQRERKTPMPIRQSDDPTRRLTDGMARHLAATEARIATWAKSWDYVYTNEQARWQAAAPQMAQAGSFQERIAAFRATLEPLRLEREEQAMYRDPAYQAWEAARHAQERVHDPGLTHGPSHTQERPAHTRESAGRGIDR
jgi:hypothetical protein